MVIFFGIVALLASTWLMLRLRHQRAFRGESEVIKSNGVSYKVERRLRVRKSQATLELGMFGSRGVDLLVQREDFFGQLLKSLGVGRDVSCKDRHLDEMLLFESDDPRVALWLQSSAEARAAIRDLFERDVKRLMMFQGRAWVVLRGRKDDVDKSDALSLRLAAPLQRLIMSVPESLHGAHERSTFHAARALILLAVSSGLGITAVLMLLAHLPARFPQHVSPFGLYGYAATFSLGLGAMLWWLAARWIKDSARARTVLFELAMIGVVALVAIGAVGAGQANVALARAPVVEELVEAGFDKTHRRRRRGGSRTSYFIVLPALHNGAIAPQRYRIDSADYWAMQRTDRVTVRSQRGFFGHYFIASMPQKAPSLNTTLKAQ